MGYARATASHDQVPTGNTCMQPIEYYFVIVWGVFDRANMVATESVYVSETRNLTQCGPA